MLSKEDNETLTRVGPGTPGGELLRRYWMPVAVAQELTPENPAMFVRILGEDLVLFRDGTGRVGLLADKCAHRNASLCYGRVEARGISCPYHGWLYDTQGNILETPPEKNDAIVRTVKQAAYPVREFIGFYWAYLGPAPAPEIPLYDVWARKDGHRKIEILPVLDCNWFQSMENSVDPAHLQVLHQEFIGMGKQPVNTTRGFTDDVADFEFRVEWYGIVKRRTYIDGKVDEHPLIFPNILRQGNATQIRIPIDDTHTAHWHVRFTPTEDGADVDDHGSIPVEYLEPYKDKPGEIHPVAKYNTRSVLAQDHMAWETQGAIADRTKEHLSYSDRGVALLRKLTFEQMDLVRDGNDPMGVIRDPNQGIIDTNLYGEAQGVKGERHPAGIYTAAQPIGAGV